MSSTAQWGAVVGATLPVFVAWLQRQNWPAGIDAAVFLAACFAAASVTNYVDHSESWNWDAWVQTTIWVSGSALATFHALWKPIGAIAKARAVGPLK